MIDGGIAVVDSSSGERDAGDPEIAPPCEVPAPRCVRVFASRRIGDRPDEAQDVSIPAIGVDATGVHVVVRLEDPNEERIMLFDRLHDHDLTSDEELLLDSFPRPNMMSVSVSVALGVTTFAWHDRRSFRGESTMETRWRSMDPTGTLSELRIADTIRLAARIEILGPTSLVLGDRVFAVSALDHELTMVDLAAATRRTVPIDAVPWGDIAAQPLEDGETFIVLWHEIGDDGFARARVAVVRSSALVTGPVTVLHHLSDRASLLVHEGQVWVAGFERLALLAESRLRVARLELPDLTRREPDRTFSGWGGLRPAGFQLVAWRGKPWMVWLSDDPRFGSLAALFAEPLPEIACAVQSADPTLVSSAPFDWSRRGAFGQLAVATGEVDREERLFIAHTIGSAGRFDIHALDATCGP